MTPVETLTAAADQITGRINAVVTFPGRVDITEPLVALLRGAAHREESVVDWRRRHPIGDQYDLGDPDPRDEIAQALKLARAILGEAAS